MTKIRCHNCFAVCACYFDHCKTKLCHINCCPCQFKNRQDRLVKAANGLWTPYFMDKMESGGNGYIVPVKYASDNFILMRVGYQKNILVLEVEEFNNEISRDTHWLYLKPVVPTSDAVKSEWTVGGKPKNYSPLLD